MFDVSSLQSFVNLQGFWLTQAQQQRLYLRQYPPSTTVVLAHMIDERRDRQVSRRDASSWCAAMGITYFESHPKDPSAIRKMLLHLARACFPEGQVGAAGGGAGIGGPRRAS